MQRRSLSPVVSILKLGLCSHKAVGILQWTQYCGMGVGGGGGGDKTPKIPPPSASEPQKTALNSKVPSLLGASNYQIAFYIGRFPEQSLFQFFHIYFVCVCVFIYHPASLNGDSAPSVQHPHPQYPLGSPLFPAGECAVGGREAGKPRGLDHDSVTQCNHGKSPSRCFLGSLRNHLET